MPLIAIDGPSGSGKSTVAAEVARRLGLACLDTGAMYRAVTLLALRLGIADDESRVTELATKIELRTDGVPPSPGGRSRWWMDAEDITEQIRGKEVSEAVSAVSAIADVRREMVRRQREWVEGRDGAVVEGRDIGSVVFPDADVKVYLTAAQSERVKRRDEQAQGTDFETGDSIARRDQLDSSRAVDPLTIAEGAVVLDSTELSVEQVIEKILEQL